MKLILNEKQLLDTSLKEGYIDYKKPTMTIKLLAKHYFSIGMNKSQAVDSINSFFINYFKGYNSVKWIDTIENMVYQIHRYNNYSLIDINCVEITESELTTIKNINDEKYEKLAFTFLVYAKIYNQMNHNDNNWVNEEHKYIFSDAKIMIKKDEQGMMIHKLCEKGLIYSTKIVDKTNVKVNFVDKNSLVVLKITDFRNFVYEYLKWKGDKIETCERCGLLIIYTNNNKKYCSICAKEVWKEQHREINREYMRKKRNVDKTEPF